MRGSALRHGLCAGRLGALLLLLSIGSAGIPPAMAGPAPRSGRRHRKRRHHRRHVRAHLRHHHAVRAAAVAVPMPAHPRLLDPYDQVLVAIADDWTSNQGVLLRYQRTRSRRFKQLGPAVPVSFGDRGLAWGRGLHGAPPGQPVKTDGDLRSPAGVFRLGTAFGHGDPDHPEPVSLTIPYRTITRTAICVKDPTSPDYDRVLDKPPVQHGLRHGLAEGVEMFRPDGLFRIAITIEDNLPDPSPGAGSCVFLHLRRGDQTTEGGTAVDAGALEQILAWLDVTQNPVLVQLPKAVYAEKRKEWGLP